mgnify:CR=1 FL=1
MKKLVVLTIALGCLALLAGAGYMVYTMFFPEGEFAAPELVAAWHEWGVVNKTVTEVRSTIIIYNPGGYSATLEALDYRIYVNDIRIAVGHLREPAEIRPKSNSTIKVSTFIDNTKLPDLWVSYVSSGEKINVEVEGEARVRAFGIAFSIPISYSKDYEPEEKLEDLLDIDEPYNVTTPTGQVIVTVQQVDTSWGNVNQTTTEFVHLVTLYNPNPTILVITQMRYETIVNGLELAEGIQPMNNITIGPYETVNITVYTYLNNTLIDDWWVSHLQNDETSNILVNVFMVLANGTEVPIYQRSFVVETDLLGALTYP